METERLIFKHYQKKDKNHFINLFTDETVMKFVDTGVFTVEKAEYVWKKILDEYHPPGKITIYAFFTRENWHYVGHGWIRPNPANNNGWEIGYILKEEEWGKGYATEIADRLIRFGFKELNLETIFATVDLDNYSSIRVLEKVGMRHVRDEYDELGRSLVYGINR